MKSDPVPRSQHDLLVSSRAGPQPMAVLSFFDDEVTAVTLTQKPPIPVKE